MSTSNLYKKQLLKAEQETVLLI